MDPRIFLAISVGPALLLLMLFKKWDEKRPEPPGKVRNMVLFGIACCIPAALVEPIIGAALGSAVNDNGHLLEAYVVAGVTEESLKLLMVLLYVYWRPHFDEVMDGVLYTAASSLGFAMLENVLYVAKGGVATGLVRAFTAVPLHATASGIMGYFVGRSKFAGAAKPLWILLGLSIAIFIHGTYDWTAMSGGGFGGEGNVGIVIGAVIGIPLVCMGILRLLVKHALSLDDKMLGTQPRPLPSQQPVQAWPQQPQAYGQPAYAPYGAAPAYPGYAPAPAYPQAQYGQPQYGQQPQYVQPPQAYPQPTYPQQPAAPQPYPQAPAQGATQPMPQGNPYGGGPWGQGGGQGGGGYNR